MNLHMIDTKNNTLHNCIILEPNLVSKIHAKIHVSEQWFSNLACEWLVAVPPPTQMPGLKIIIN